MICEDLLFYLISSLKQQNITVFVHGAYCRHCLWNIYCFKLRQEICIRAYGELAPAHWTWSPIKLSGPSERSGAAAFITADSGLPPESRDCFGRESFSPYYPSSPSPLSIPFVFTPSAQQYVFVPFTSQHFYVPLSMSSRHRFWFVIDTLRLTTGLEQLMHHALHFFFFFYADALNAAMNQRCKSRQKMLRQMFEINRAPERWDKSVRPLVYWSGQLNSRGGL